jgi:hypothetical protein
MKNKLDRILQHWLLKDQFMVKMPLDKLTPFIDENFPHSHPFQIVDRRAVEVSNVTAIKKLIKNHGFCPLRENQLSSTEMTLAI